MNAKAVPDALVERESTDMNDGMLHHPTKLLKRLSCASFLLQHKHNLRSFKQPLYILKHPSNSPSTNKSINMSTSNVGNAQVYEAKVSLSRARPHISSQC
jgi:hypothetical protein